MYANDTWKGPVQGLNQILFLILPDNHGEMSNKLNVIKNIFSLTYQTKQNSYKRYHYLIFQITLLFQFNF